MDLIVIGVVAVILIAVSAYIIKEKKSGKKCIGCPDSCAYHCQTNDKGCSCGCGR